MRIRAAARQTKLKEIELELKRGPTEKLEEFASQIMRLSGLPFSKKSKVKTATALLNGGEK
jgi:inorganic triphosphatase YgiF